MNKSATEGAVFSTPVTYTLKVECNNCGWDGEVIMARGKPVSEGVCPDCGCVKLWRIPKSIL